MFKIPTTIPAMDIAAVQIHGTSVTLSTPVSTPALSDRNAICELIASVCSEVVNDVAYPAYYPDTFELPALGPVPFAFADVTGKILLTFENV